VINGVLAPFLLLVILAVASDATLMHGQPSSLRSRVLVGTTAAVMFAAAIAMFVV
jgi:Mn2+/Fe2+ NRAMP family transporter